MQEKQYSSISNISQDRTSGASGLRGYQHSGGYGEQAGQIIPYSLLHKQVS